MSGRISPFSAADGPFDSVLYPKAISDKEFATGLFFDFAVHRNRTFTDKVLRLASRVGEPGYFESLDKGNVFAPEW